MSDDVKDIMTKEDLESRDVQDGSTIEAPPKSNVLGLMSQLFKLNGLTNLSQPGLEEALKVLDEKFK
jgi:hypothetical protein